MVGIKVGGLNWLKSNGFITAEEYKKSMDKLSEKQRARQSGEPPPGLGGAEAVPAAAPSKRKLDRTEEAWVKANALPPVQGCTVTHVQDLSRNKWTIYYPGCNSCSRNYGATTGIAAGRTSIMALNAVLHWAWERHRIRTGVANQVWDFEPRCT